MSSRQPRIMASLLEQVIKGTSNNTTDTNGRKISVDGM